MESELVSSEEWAIPKGSLILVTGANGFIGSHVADQFLQYGFKVRGSVRNVEKNIWLPNHFHRKYGPASFELCQIPDMAVEGAFDEAVRGVTAVVHTAHIMTLDHNPNNVIPGAVAFALNALKAAYATNTAQRFVYCSSSTAAVLSSVDQPGIVVTERTWNEASVQDAWAPPPYELERSHAVYSASKTLAEQAVWNYHKLHSRTRPDLVVNTVLPNMTVGASLDPANQGFPSTAGMIALLYKGEVMDYHRSVPRQWYVNVQDVGRLHVAVAVLSDVQAQRIFAFAGRFNWDYILDAMRKFRPTKAFPENFSGGEDTNEIEPRHKAERLLRALGEPGWVSLDLSVQQVVVALETQN